VLDFLFRSHPEKPERISDIFANHCDYGLVERCHRIETRKATNEELLLIHGEEHILKMQNTQKLQTPDLLQLQNRYESIYLNKSTYEAALHSAGSVLQVKHHKYIFGIGS
jgi:histone deacetylase 6